ncbi:MAG: GntR family transcriptional regulator [Oscillospiraceae bacterium]
MHLYSQIENYILDDIKSGKLTEGDMIPPETVLSKDFNVSRPTVRQALNNLVNEGYLVRIKGKGSFVTKPKIIQESTKFIESYNAEMKKKGLIPKTLVLSMDIVEPNEMIKIKLNLKDNEKAIKLKRLRFVVSDKEEKPVLLTTVYIPYKLFPNLIMYDFEKHSLYDVLDQNNLSVRKVIREIEARGADSLTSKLLEINEGFPVHFINSIGFLESGEIIEYSESIYPSDRNKFVIEIVR